MSAPLQRASSPTASDPHIGRSAVLSFATVGRKHFLCDAPCPHDTRTAPAPLATNRQSKAAAPFERMNGTLPVKTRYGEQHAQEHEVCSCNDAVPRLASLDGNGTSGNLYPMQVTRAQTARIFCSVWIQRDIQVHQSVAAFQVLLEQSELGFRSSSRYSACLCSASCSKPGSCCSWDSVQCCSFRSKSSVPEPTKLFPVTISFADKSDSNPHPALVPVAAKSPTCTSKTIVTSTEQTRACGCH